MRILYFGTPELAVPCLERLIASRFDVVGVVSQPDRRRGRGRKTSPSPVSRLALDAGIPLVRPEHVGAPDAVAALAALTPDLGVVVAFGQFLPRRIRELPRLGFLINAHASLLPRYRGAAPIQHAILAGESRTGISVMRVERKMDVGPVGLVHEIEIGAQETAGELSDRLAELAADAIEKALGEIEAGRLVFAEQDHARASEAPKLERDGARLDWSQENGVLARRIRAFSPKPGAFTTWYDQVLRILAADIDADACALPPGTVERPDANRMRIATGSGWLVPRHVQRAGGKAMDIEPFLRGNSIEAGVRLGEPAEASATNPEVS